MAKIYVFLADGCETIEALTPVDILRRAGMEVTTVSIMGQKEIESAQGVTLYADALFENVDIGAADMLILPGGMPGTANLAAYTPLIAALHAADKEHKLIGAICAAPALVLGENGFLTGRRATCYPGMEARMKGAVAVTDPVVTDGNITTSRGMGTALDFSLRLLSILSGEETSRQMAENVVYLR